MTEGTSIHRIVWENLPATALKQNVGFLQEWNRLNAARGDIPFLDADAIVSALEILGEGNERLLVGREGSTVVAIFLLVPDGLVRWRTFQPSQIPLGAWVADSQFPLMDIAQSLVRGPLGLSLVLSITQVDPLFTPRTADTPNACHSDYIETGWIDIQGTYEEYWNTRGKNLRQNMRKQRAKLEIDGIKVCMKAYRNHQDMAAAIERYGILESSGWKAAQGTAVHPNNAQGRFYRALLESAALRGETVVYEYQFNNQTVAMNLCLQRKGVLIVLKTTYDESIQSFSPAFLLRQEEMQEFFKNGTITRLEYYGRLMEWHTKWTSNKRTIYHLSIYRWPFLKQFAEWRRRKSRALGQDKSA